jgi:hypothetical protein
MEEMKKQCGIKIWDIMSIETTLETVRGMDTGNKESERKT